MAKRPRATDRPAKHPTPADYERAELAADDLKRFWLIGRKSRRKRPKSDPSTFWQGNASEEAAAYGLSLDALEKARAAATLFTKAEVDGLCREIRKHGAAFGPSHLRTLLSVAGRKLRNKLAQDAVRRRWSVRELRSAVYAAKGRIERAGRPPQIPKDGKHVLAALITHCGTWTRFCEDGSDRFPDGLKDVLKDAKVAVDRVETAASKFLER